MFYVFIFLIYCFSSLSVIATVFMKLLIVFQMFLTVLIPWYSFSSLHWVLKLSLNWDTVSHVEIERWSMGATKKSFWTIWPLLSLLTLNCASVAYIISHFFVRGHPLSTYAKFSEKLRFLNPWYANVCVRIKWLEMLVFRKILHRYLRDDSLLPYIPRSSSQLQDGSTTNFSVLSWIGILLFYK